MDGGVLEEALIIGEGFGERVEGVEMVEAVLLKAILKQKSIFDCRPIKVI
jgi:hypothetical protein